MKSRRGSERLKELSVCKEITIALRSGWDGVVPVPVEGIRLQPDRGKLGFADLDPLWICACVQLASDVKPGSGRGSGDQVDNHFVAHERLAAPVLRDK